MHNYSYMKSKIIQSNTSWIPFVLRITLAIVVLPHGAQKLLGWFGGYGFTGTMQFFTETAGLSWLVGCLVILLETLGALALMAGLVTRLFALSYLGLAIGILFTQHIHFGFFMNWSGAQPGEGIEYFIFWIGIAVCLFISGGGRYSVDTEILMKRIKE